MKYTLNPTASYTATTVHNARSLAYIRRKFSNIKREALTMDELTTGYAHKSSVSYRRLTQQKRNEAFVKYLIAQGVLREAA